MLIRKVQFGKQTVIVYSNDNTDEVCTTLKSKDQPTDEFVNAVSALKSHIASICELPIDYINKGNVPEVRFTNSKELTGAVMIAKIKLEQSTTPLIIKTPHLTENATPGSISSIPCLSNQCTIDLEKIKECAIAFIAGSRVKKQPELQ